MSNEPIYGHIKLKSPATPKFVIEQIQRKHKISTYLADRGISPRMDNGGHKIYHCPLPSHPNDKSPSFYVYDKGDYEDYFCFGCKNGGSIVQFVAEYERIGMRQAAQILSEGIGIDVEDIMDAIILEIVSDMERSSPQEALELAFCLNKSLNDYIRAVEFDPHEIEIADKAGRLIEKYLYAENTDALRLLVHDDSKDSLDYHIRHRVNLFNCRKQEEEIEHIRRAVSGDQYGRTSQEVLRENDRSAGS